MRQLRQKIAYLAIGCHNSPKVKYHQAEKALKRQVRGKTSKANTNSFRLFLRQADFHRIFRPFSGGTVKNCSQPLKGQLGTKK